MQPATSSSAGPGADCDSASGVPLLARKWTSASQVISAVRRPSKFPDPESYHEIIEPEAIFELDEKQKDGSIETILVVPFGCTRCRSMKQACSRALPACARCRKAGAGSSCQAFQEGYQRLPRPKFGRLSAAAKASSSSHNPESQSTASRSRAKRTASGLASLSIASGLKRSFSPESDSDPPRKKALAKSFAKATSRGGPNARRRRISKCQDMDVDMGTSAAASGDGRSNTLKWTFIKNARGRNKTSSQGQERSHPAPSTTPSRAPRVWTNSLNAFLTVFPELAKAPVGFSWFQSDTPVLLLDTNYAQGYWINSTTLAIDLLWDFSCHDSELEPLPELGTEASTHIQPDPSQPTVPSPDNIGDCKVDIMDQRCSPPRDDAFSAHMAVSTPPPTSTLLPLGGAPQDERSVCQDTYDACVERLTCDTTQNAPMSPVSLNLEYPSSPLTPLEDLPPLDSYLMLDEPLADHMISQNDARSRIPLDRPPEVETLMDCHLRFIPLLLWTPHHSELVPCSLPPEYACSCLGLFCVSDLRHTAIRRDGSSAGIAQGRVSWSVTLQWAPGGEDALFDCGPPALSNGMLDPAPLDDTRDLMHPWWFDPTDTLSQTDYAKSHHLNDFKTIFSFIPLDFLAEFHPSESFPRGWFCKLCGMINMQEHFRHQICRSTTCRTARKNCIPEGKVDALSRLRDVHQSSTLTRPVDKIPSTVLFDSVTWDDDMQSWNYDINDGAKLCHIFTGNQDHLQDDATVLLKRIQAEVLLRRENASSPYFTHTTRLEHSSDESGVIATVPGGTPQCVRIAYYTLCDLVHRYAEMDTPRFGMVHMQAWVSPGSKKGSVFRASRSPVVVHCLGAGAILNLTPRGGYKAAAVSTPATADKGKGKERAEDDAQPGSSAAEPPGEPPRPSEHDGGDQPSFISALEAIESPIVAEHVNEAMATMDTALQCRSSDAGGVAIPNSNAPHFGSGMEVADHGSEPKPGRGRKKNKVTKDKNKTSVSEISMTLVHGDCVVLYGDDFECQIVRVGTTILVMGFPEGI